MGNKKGLAIKEVRVEGKIVSVIATDGSLFKVTRTQRNLLCNYKHKDYIAEIKKSFSNDHIVANDFKVIKNGEIKFQL